MRHLLTTSLFAAATLFAGEPELPKFEAQEIDGKVGIGYGVTTGDVDGDGKLDIILADKKHIVWYSNPDWKRHVIAENTTKLDNVCVAARDIDGDGKVEIAYGAMWNPGDTENSGSVHYCIPGADRKQPWTWVDLHREPTVHRMRWIKNAQGKFGLLVSPLHGRGNKNGEGVGVKQLEYIVPADVKGEWKTVVMNDQLHITHNFDPFQLDGDPEEEVLLCGRDGIVALDRTADGWKSIALVNAGDQGFPGAGEIRFGLTAAKKSFFATVEPWHGKGLVVYTRPDSGATWQRRVLDEGYAEAHAVATGDLLGDGSNCIVVGWRKPNAAGKVGVHVWLPLDTEAKQWKKTVLDDNGMACEDVCIADLDGDGKLDVIAAGRATFNLKVYWNKR